MKEIMNEVNIEISVGNGKVLIVSSRKLYVNRMVFTKAAGRTVNDAVPCDTFPGERNMVENAARKPIRLYINKVKVVLLFSTLSHRKAHKINNEMTKIMKVVGGSENPPITNAARITKKLIHHVIFFPELI